MVHNFFIIWSQEKNFEPEPVFEPQSCGSLIRRSTTWAILVLLPAPAGLEIRKSEVRILVHFINFLLRYEYVNFPKQKL